MPRDGDQYKDRPRRRDSPNSSDSEYSQKSSKRKHKSERSRRSRSREKSSLYYRNRRSLSRGKKKSRRSISRSPSRYYSSRRRSPSRERHARRRLSRSVSRDRSESYKDAPERSSKVKHKTIQKPSKNDSRKKSSSRSTSPHNRDEIVQNVDSSKKYIVDDTESKIKKAIKAAEAVGLTMCKLPSYEYKEVEVKEDMPTIQDRNVLDELNSESFAPKHFLSSRSKKIPENIVIDLDSETVKLTDVEIPKAESLFHPEVLYTRAIPDLYKDLTHRQLMEITNSSLDTILHTDNLLSDTPSDITLEEVLLKIAVEHGKSITLTVHRDDDISINVIIPQSGSTVFMLKMAIRRSFELHLRRSKVNNMKISWRYVWRTHHLEYDGQLLHDDTGCLADYGVINRSIIKFTKKLRKKNISCS